MKSIKSVLSDPKALSLIVLTLQNTCLVLTMRVSRTQKGVSMYLASVAVMTDELMKLAVCCVMLVLAYRTAAKTAGYRLVTNQGNVPDGPDGPPGQLSVSGFLRFFRTEVFKSTFEFCKMSVPAICYAVQKNLLYIAITNLDAAVFQVAYQGKILSTALFSVLVLGRKMGPRQVVALFILLTGVALVQLSSFDGSATGGAKKDNAIAGSLAVAAACCTSGFAAIYFEWILKFSAPQEQRPYSLWVRNFQLAIFAAAGAAIGVYSKDGPAVGKDGLYQGFSPLVWTVVSLEAFGGIVVALVIKYADNILKNFATAVSIVTSTIVSAVFLGFNVKPMFVLGAVCVMGAVALYTSNPKTPLLVRPHEKQEEATAVLAAPNATKSGSGQSLELTGMKIRAPTISIKAAEKAEI